MLEGFKEEVDEFLKDQVIEAYVKMATKRGEAWGRLAVIRLNGDAWLKHQVAYSTS